MKIVLVIFACVLCSGCITSRTYRLPNLTAEEINVTHVDSFGTITARATGIRVTEHWIIAAEAEWRISYPFWNDTVMAKNYRQKRQIERMPRRELSARFFQV